MKLRGSWVVGIEASSDFCLVVCVCFLQFGDTTFPKFFWSCHHVRDGAGLNALSRLVLIGWLCVCIIHLFRIFLNFK